MRRTCTLAAILGLALLLMIGPRHAQAGPAGWRTYTDARYGFSLAYPANWQVIPRDDRPGSYGGVVTFTPGRSSQAGEGTPQVVVGLHTIAREPGQALADWTTEYLRLSSPLDPSEVTIEAAQPAAALAQRIPETLALRGRSPLTSFQLTNIPHGQTVWFVWTNITDARAQIYDQMVASFNLGARTPISLAAAFGPGFTPLARTLPDVGKGGEASIAAISLPDNTWLVPTPAGTTYNVKCGSSAHTGTAAYALDIQVAVSTGVYSSHRSWVDFAGWNSDGYGNLIRASTDFIYPRTYTAYYAHLSSFVASGGQALGGGTLIAYSGNTGNSSGPHLHFHVRAASDAVDARNLNNFAENSNYPSGNANCGTVRR